MARIATSSVPRAAAIKTPASMKDLLMLNRLRLSAQRSPAQSLPGEEGYSGGNDAGTKGPKAASTRSLWRIRSGIASSYFLLAAIFDFDMLILSFAIYG